MPAGSISVITASTYNSTANGSITDAGTLVSITSIADGTYNALIYKPSTSEVIETDLTIASNQVSDSSFYGSLFTLLGADTDYSVYQIESLNLEEDGLVSISAVEVPTDASGVSIVAKDVLTPGNFTVFGDGFSVVDPNRPSVHTRELPQQDLQLTIWGRGADPVWVTACQRKLSLSYANVTDVR